MNPTEESSLQDYLRVIRKRKWVVIFTAIVITSSAAVFSFLQTPIYEASTTLHLKKAKPGPGQIDVFGGVSLLPAETEINTQIEIIKSHIMMEEVVRRLFSPVNPQEPSNESSKDKKVESFSEIAERLREKSISVVAIPNTRLITLSASSPDPEIAQSIAKTAAEVFIQRDISSRRRETTAALDFLSRETEKAAKNLQQAEENLKTYKEREGFAELSEKARLMVERFSELESLYQSTRMSRQELSNRLREIRSQLKKVSKVWVSSTYISDNPVVQMLRSRLTDLEIKYGQLTREFPSDDPEVIHIKTQIEETKKELKSKVQTVVAGKTESINPIYTELYTKLVTYETEINALKAKEDALTTLVAEYEKGISRLPQQELTLARLERDQRVSAELYAILVKAKNKAEIESASEIGTIEVVDPARKPISPVKPKKERNALVGAIAGLMLGVFFSFFLEYSDKTIKTEEEAKKLLNLPILGIIPRLDTQSRRGYAYHHRSGGKKKRKELKARILEENKSSIDLMTPDLHQLEENYSPIELVSRDHPKSHISEAYQALITNLQFAEVEPKTLVVTSSIPLEGKTSVVVNLAITLASARQKVLLVDADLRLSNVHRIFKLDPVPGLTDVLKAETDPNLVIHRVEGLNNLDLLTSGSLPPNPSELLRSSKMKELILQFQKEYDYVLFDSPPLLGVADVSILSPNADGVLLVLALNEVNRRAAQKAKESLEKVRAHILGVVLNKVEPEYSSYGEYYHYYSDHEET